MIFLPEKSYINLIFYFAKMSLIDKLVQVKDLPISDKKVRDIINVFMSERSGNHREKKGSININMSSDMGYNYFSIFGYITNKELIISINMTSDEDEQYEITSKKYEKYLIEELDNSKPPILIYNTNVDTDITFGSLLPSSVKSARNFH